MKTTGKQPLPRVAYGIREVTQACGVSVGFVRLEIARGKLAAFRAGRRVLVRRESFEAYTAGVEA